MVWTCTAGKQPPAHKPLLHHGSTSVEAGQSGIKTHGCRTLPFVCTFIADASERSSSPRHSRLRRASVSSPASQAAAGRRARWRAPLLNGFSERVSPTSSLRIDKGRTRRCPASGGRGRYPRPWPMPRPLHAQREISAVGKWRMRPDLDGTAAMMIENRWLRRWLNR
jgi:hypothetical protein